MTSPVDTSVKFFHSKMLGAPVLRGQAGSLIAILDACLVNGWGIQTAASCVVAGGVCTMTFPLDHAALVDAVILVDGASIAALNGEQKVTSAGPNTLKFATTAPNGTATGTITAKMAPLGFAKPFSGTNLAVYKSLDVQANGQFLRVNDASALYARANGYENMTAVSSGTGLFPASAQLSGGLYWHKSDTPGTVPIDWLLVGDGRFFVMLTSIGQGGDILYKHFIAPLTFGFGDPVNLGRSADPFSTTIFGNIAVSVSNYGAMDVFTGSDNTLRYMCRAISGVGGSVPARYSPVSSADPGDEMFDRITGQVVFSELVVRTGADRSRRARLPGVCCGFSGYMDAVFPVFNVFKAGDEGRYYVAHYGATGLSAATNFALIAIDVTGPWR